MLTTKSIFGKEHVEEGKKEATLETARNLKALSASIDMIANNTDLSTA